MERETFAYHNWRHVKTRPSRYVEGERVEDESFTICPRCRTLNKALGHGDRTTCVKCGLQMELLGNGLTIWDGGS